MKFNSRLERYESNIAGTAGAVTGYLILSCEDASVHFFDISQKPHIMDGGVPATYWYGELAEVRGQS